MPEVWFSGVIGKSCFERAYAYTRINLNILFMQFTKRFVSP